MKYIAAATLSTYAILNYLLPRVGVKSRQENTGQPFRTQLELFEGIKDVEGKPCKPLYCHPMSSAWLEKKIQGLDADFLKDEGETLKLTAQVNDEIGQMRRRGEDYANYAFVKTRQHYEEKELPFYQVQTKEGLENTLATHQNAFFVYPTKKPDLKHAVAYHRDGKGNCSFFDPNYPGGEVTDSCAQLSEFIAKRLRETGSLDPQQKEKVKITLDTPAKNSS